MSLCILLVRLFAFLVLSHGATGFLSRSIPTTSSSPTTHSAIVASLRLSSLKAGVRLVILKDDDNEDEEEEEDDDEEEEEQDPYTQKATSEFLDDNDDKSSSALSTLTGSSIDWGGALGKLRQRVQDVESGASQDPSTALFRFMSAKTPNELIGTFVQTANPKVVQACSDAVNSLLGGLSSPSMGIETIVKTNGEKIGSLCFQLQMTGYLFRNVEYVLALKEMMALQGAATLQDYKDAFDKLDTDDSGFIEPAEVQTLLDDVYQGTAPKFEVDAFVKFFDRNQDGKISWTEFESGLGAAMTTTKSRPKLLQSRAGDDDDEDEEDDEEPMVLNYEVTGDIEIELDNGETITVEAKEYIKSLKQEAAALREALEQQQLPDANKAGTNGMLAAQQQQQSSSADYGGIAQYIAQRQGDIKALTEGIQPEIVETMKMLVDFVLQGGDPARTPQPKKEEMEMELPGSALQQLALWQLVLGYRLREAEATGEYLKLLE
ncbi:expressed unknown protein [Seminavis robusta]|uniref:EF-hand domain-containing protein n=1 Tax=Seminavis robusta TaxID=568900 RepID=A0A9N8H7X4_9STRA|nr:expressed unknown protein [Seminavis robusta]|eukprot:Sro153_g069760.1 n/a (491) ;mRNA; f:62567-64138